jgi:hypothetical protein
MHRRSVLRVAIVIGALLGAALPYIAGGGSVSFFTDIEARIGYGVLAAFVYVAFGAVAGWAVGSLALRALAHDERPPE